MTNTLVSLHRKVSFIFIPEWLFHQIRNSGLTIFFPWLLATMVSDDKCVYLNTPSSYRQYAVFLWWSPKFVLYICFSAVWLWCLWPWFWVYSAWGLLSLWFYLYMSFSKLGMFTATIVWIFLCMKLSFGNLLTNIRPIITFILRPGNPNIEVISGLTLVNCSSLKNGHILSVFFCTVIEMFF